MEKDKPKVLYKVKCVKKIVYILFLIVITCQMQTTYTNNYKYCIAVKVVHTISSARILLLFLTISKQNSVKLYWYHSPTYQLQQSFARFNDLSTAVDVEPA